MINNIIQNFKKCSKCKKDKAINEFSKQKAGKYGVRGECKQCTKIYNMNNKERIKKYYQEYNMINRQKINKYRSQYDNDNKEKIKKQKKEYYSINKENIRNRHKNYYINNKEIFSKNSKKYYIYNQIQINKQTKKYYENNKIKRKEYDFIKKYNLTLQDWYQMLKDQYYQCAICNKLFDLDNTRDICIDHNHQTNQIRKLLCNSCNYMLQHGKNQDVSVEILNNSIGYLNKKETNYKYYTNWKKYHEIEYKRLLNTCNGSCEICNLKFTKDNKKTKENHNIFPFIDHDHKTGMIRGILCDICNKRLGNSRENKFILQNINIYLLEYK